LEIERGRSFLAEFFIKNVVTTAAKDVAALMPHAK